MSDSLTRTLLLAAAADALTLGRASTTRGAILLAGIRLGAVDLAATEAQACPHLRGYAAWEALVSAHRASRGLS